MGNIKMQSIYVFKLYHSDVIVIHINNLFIYVCVRASGIVNFFFLCRSRGVQGYYHTLSI